MSETNTTEVRDKRNDAPVFIHSDLDDYGLNPVEFRAYARLARRAYKTTARESVPNMARAIGVSDRTLQRALKVLVCCRLVDEEVHPGRPTVYTLMPRRAWRHSSHLADARKGIGIDSRAKVNAKPERASTPDAHVTGDTRAPGVVTPEHRVVVTPEMDEGSPSEGSPLKTGDNARGTRARRPPVVNTSPSSTARAAPDEHYTPSRTARGKPIDERLKHPAVLAIKKHTGYFPPESNRDEIIAALGDEPDVERLAECYKAWGRISRNGGSSIPALEWYVGGIPERASVTPATMKGDDHGSDGKQSANGASGNPQAGGRRLTRSERTEQTLAARDYDALFATG